MNLSRAQQILGVSRDASPEAIRGAYLELAKVWHPDRFANEKESLRNRAHDEMKAINEAYRTLYSSSAADSREKHKEEPSEREQHEARSAQADTPHSTAPPPQFKTMSGGSMGQAVRWLQLLIVLLVAWKAWDSWQWKTFDAETAEFRFRFIGLAGEDEVPKCVVEVKPRGSLGFYSAVGEVWLRNMVHTWSYLNAHQEHKWDTICDSLMVEGYSAGKFPKALKNGDRFFIIWYEADVARHPLTTYFVLARRGNTWATHELRHGLGRLADVRDGYFVLSSLPDDTDDGFRSTVGFETIEQAELPKNGNRIKFNGFCFLNGRVAELGVPMGLNNYSTTLEIENSGDNSCVPRVLEVSKFRCNNQTYAGFESGLAEAIGPLLAKGQQFRVTKWSQDRGYELECRGDSDTEPAPSAEGRIPEATSDSKAPVDGQVVLPHSYTAVLSVAPPESNVTISLADHSGKSVNLSGIVSEHKTNSDKSVAWFYCDSRYAPEGAAGGSGTVVSVLKDLNGSVVYLSKVQPTRVEMVCRKR